MHGELLVLTIAVSFPDFPGSRSTGAKTLELLLILKGIHTRPEAIVGIADQLFLLQQPLERFANQFLSLLYIVEDAFLENEEAAVDPDRAVVYGINSHDQIGFVLLKRNQMIAEVRPDTDETGNFILLMKMVELLRQRKVSEAVTIVGQKFVFSVQIFFDSLQALTDIGVNPGVRESDSPVLDVAVEQL